jgi:hypothetical protein
MKMTTQTAHVENPTDDRAVLAHAHELSELELAMISGGAGTLNFD